jgi:arginyl-tRNA synthetase
MTGASTPNSQGTSTPLTDTVDAAAGAAGVIAREEQAAIQAIREALNAAGVSNSAGRPVDLRPIPFEGTWGSASTICRMVAGELVTAELEASGALEGLSKKETKKLVNARVSERAQELAETVAEHIRASGRFPTVEAANGYINISYDAQAMTITLIREALEQNDTYGHAVPGSRGERVMIEHSQLNTHKAAHVGHLRNICLGVAMTNISTAGGFTTMPVTYIGDIGRHVIRCLWCYSTFHQGEEPAGNASRGRWLGELYVEAGARLGFRDDVLSFLKKLVQEDPVFVESIDGLLKALWASDTPVDGEDIAYLLGKITTDGEIKPDELIDENVLVAFWPILGHQLRAEADGRITLANGETDDESLEAARAAAAERFATWQQLDEHMAEWWPQVPQWLIDEKATFQLWETKDPAFVQLWETTRQWSMDELEAIFEEFGAHFDVWFSESEVEEDGRKIARELLQRGIAEISDGLPVVKIDEKLGLVQETYRTMPILRSDGSTLYSTKDLALAQRKFQQYDVDRAIWVVDVRQSLYFDQITKILELYGFEQAQNNFHYGYEFVTLPNGIMSSRRGNAPMLEDVRNAMMERALSVIREKNPTLPEDEQQKVAHDVAIGSIKYVMLARDGNKVIVFDPDEALSFEGHAAPYIQYAHARACRILEHAGVTDEDILASLDTADYSSAQAEELSLLQQISAFPETVQRAATEYRPLHITNYVFELAKRFNDFYHACPVLQAEPNVRQARLGLVTATRLTLRNGLALLGIAAPTQM